MKKIMFVLSFSLFSASTFAVYSTTAVGSAIGQTDRATSRSALNSAKTAGEVSTSGQTYYDSCGNPVPCDSGTCSVCALEAESTL